jgi:eukaryotic-like serine/threonine-protein kinase
MTPRAARPRRLGLLYADDRARGMPARGPYPYAVGDRIAGDFTITGHLAIGRLCHLYQVWSASEWCAFTCKILAPDRRSRRADVSTLRREARILGGTRHPNLVRHYGQGEHEGSPYLLMEYLEGPSIFELLEASPSRRLPVADAVRVAIHICAAIYHLHRRGYLYLDTKPANLLLRDRVPVVVDLDSARRRRPGLLGNGIGTAPYMAPEQVSRQPISAATDVYGIGALLYELLTGRWPFEDVYQEEEPREGVERQYPQVSGEPPSPPSWFEPATPPTLERTVMRCLAADPAERFDSVHALLRALSEELSENDALWPSAVRVERRAMPRDDG